VSEAHEVIEHESKPVAETTEGATSLLQVIERAARSPEVDIDKMERLMEMHERIVRKRAEEGYNAAMAEAQAKMRRVSTDAVNPQTRSNYATYGALDRALRPVYTDAGFALSFDSEPSPLDQHVRVLCIVSHRDGFSRTHHIDMPNDGKGAKGNDVMTKTHAQGAAMSYGMRYLLKMIFNVAIGEDDRDGNESDESLPDEYAAELKQMLHDTEADVARFLKALSARTKVQIGSVDEIPAAHYLTAKTMIENNAKRKQSGD
jgi:hypothetical protein